jgi:ketosteroid isomerase-like protein
MSEENVELARRAFEAFNRRDLDTMLALADEEIVVESRLAAVEGGYHGHQGVRRWWADTLDVLPDYEVEVDEVRDFGDVTLARLRARAHGAGSAAPLEEVVWNVARWRAGRNTWWHNCMTEEEALEAAGLRE